MIKGSKAPVSELKAMREQLTSVNEANQHLQTQLLGSEIALAQMVSQLVKTEEAKRQCRRDIETARKQLEESRAVLKYLKKIE